MTALPAHLVDMVRRPMPIGCGIVTGSTPVIAFGDPRTAEVATLGINPSWAEFEQGGVLLTGDQRRLAAAADLGLATFEEATDEQVRRIVDDCATYFDRRPYWRWFRPLEKLLAHAGIGSYSGGTACHLDLVQWATRPVWGKLETAARATLLADGVPHLRAQLRHDNIRVVLLNGRAVLDQVGAVGLVELHEVGQLEYRPGKRTRLYTGEAVGVVVLGWSANIQSGFGTNSNAFLEKLGLWISTELPGAGDGDTEAALPPPLDAPQDPPQDAPQDAPHDASTGHLLRGLRLTGVEQLTLALRGWLRDSCAATIGDVGRFGGTPWVRVELGATRLVLNADSKRSAVESFVRQAAAGRLSLRAVTNDRGTVNKVVFEPDGSATPGWYCYTTAPLDREQEL